MQSVRGSQVEISKSGSAEDGKSGPEPGLAGKRLVASESRPTPGPPYPGPDLNSSPNFTLAGYHSDLALCSRCMAPRVVPPPKKNRARCGLKYSLKIVRGDLGPEADYLDEEGDEAQTALAVADVDINEGNEHHLQAALATKAVFIPTPGAVQLKEEVYEQLYPPGRWRDPITYVQTTQTVEEATANALVDDECTYYMDEADKQWLDKNNQEARGEGTSAQGATSAARAARRGKDKEPQIGVPVSINEDEFELVMGLFEKITDQNVIEGEGPDFSMYRHFFLEPLPANLFASYTAPSWIPPPALLDRIARTIFPHWKHRRSLSEGHKLRPSLNYNEFDFPNESYICFRRRDNKPVRKTRAGQVANNVDKLAQIRNNLSQALTLANALLKRENIKKEMVAGSQNVWNVRQPLADLLRTFPGMATKTDEALLVEKPRKIKPPRAPLPKVKVLPPSNPAAPESATIGKATRPSERCAAIQEQVMVRMGIDAQRNQGQIDATNDPYQPPLLSRAEKLWAEVPPVAPQSDEQSMRSGSCALRVRYGRGGRRFVDRRNYHPYSPPLLSRRHPGDDLDEESMRRLEAQWRFDEDDCPAPRSAEQHRELVDEYESKYLIARMAWVTQPEIELVTDASIVIPGPEGRERKVLPFLTNAIHLSWARSISLNEYLSDAIGIPRMGPRISAPTTPSQQRTPSDNVTPPRAPAPATSMRPPPTPGPQLRMQENISPPTPSAVPSPHAYASPSKPRAPPRTHTPAAPSVPHNPNPIVPAAEAQTAKPVVAQSGHGRSQNSPSHIQVPSPAHPSAQPLQTNGARTTVPAYVPLSAGTNVSLKLPPRMPRPSPLATHSVIAPQNPSISPHNSASRRTNA
ncbi:hypothetical protein B0H15DRAFT_350878 [Mycena belliarum]|uniref:Enhancer of polycomb-like protein n=1 Tax=Mycena belliarum TaxID=1033014 RepID=A0AAD6XQ86_9AGAR|nr:hypothetical protein B0H15DRAFT_350878 [Mycena belliae]